MSTNSTIVEKTPEGYRAIYCHYDGYKSGVGSVLKNHYQDSQKVSNLIDLGSISVLKESCENTIAYHRDRGEPLEPLKVYKSIAKIKEAFGNEYLYLFKDGEWTCNGKSF